MANIVCKISLFRVIGMHYIMEGYTNMTLFLYRLKEKIKKQFTKGKVLKYIRKLNKAIEPTVTTRLNTMPILTQ